MVPKIALMMEAASTSETMVNFYQTTLRYNPEDSHLRTHRREKIKSYFVSILFALLVDLLVRRHHANSTGHVTITRSNN
jgi:hypothetical protein